MNKIVILIILAFIGLNNYLLITHFLQEKDALKAQYQTLREGLAGEYSSKIAELNNQITRLEEKIKLQTTAIETKNTQFTRTSHKEPPLIKPVEVTIKQPIPEPTPKPTLPATNDAQTSRFFNEGITAYQRGDFTRAKQLLSKVIETAPPIFEAHLYYGWAAYHENPGKAASDSFLTELLEVLPAEYDPAGDLSKLKGCLALERGQFRDASDFLEISLKYNKNPSTLFSLGVCYMQLEKEEKASGIFKELAAHFPGTPEAAEAGTFIELLGGTG